MCANARSPSNPAFPRAHPSAYPLAVILHELSWFGFFEFLVFLLILLVAYVYIWKKGALEWH